MKRTLQILALALIVALTIGLYKAKTDAAAARAHVADLQSQITDTQADMRALRAEIAHLESPARVEAMAQSELGLHPGAQSTALPESAIADHLPAPRKPATPH